jgi:hypothetical protein
VRGSVLFTAEPFYTVKQPLVKKYKRATGNSKQAQHEFVFHPAIGERGICLQFVLYIE